VLQNLIRDSHLTDAVKVYEMLKIKGTSKKNYVLLKNFSAAGPVPCILYGITAKHKVGNGVLSISPWSLLYTTETNYEIKCCYSIFTSPHWATICYQIEKYCMAKRKAL